MTHYQFGRMKLVKDGTRFTLEGDVSPNNNESDHFQLIYEALEIAALSQDKFGPEFQDMVSELMNLSADWDNQL